MGKVIRKLAESAVPAKTIFDKRVVVECCETFHLHWRNLRLELTHETWTDFLATMLEADRVWREGGAPASHTHFELARTLIDTDQVLNGTSAGAELCENLYKIAPPPFGLHAEFYDDDEFVHFHYRDLRVEMSVEDFLAFSKVMADARDRLLVDRARTLARLFAVLDEANVIWSVARNWENLPDKVAVGPHSDLDLLVHPAHLELVEELWGAMPTNPRTNPAQRRVPVVAPDGTESFILVDLRSPGDGYYPDAFTHRALATRVRHDKGFWTLAPREHLLALAYHVVHHKGLLTGDYLVKLLELARETGTPLSLDGTEFGQLARLLETEGVPFAQPDDAGVLGPMPFLHRASTVLSSRFLIAAEGMPFLSRVYDVERDGVHVIVKQTTGDLAAREAAVLRRLDGPHFPRALDESRTGPYSTCTIEAIEGRRLDADAWKAIADSDVRRFVEGCLDALCDLRQAGVAHRDIRAANVIVRDGRPVLIDFGWAVHEDLQFPPAVEAALAPVLGGDGRPPDGSYCDVHAMGVMLQPLSELVPALEPLVGAMTAPAERRVTDPARLAELIPTATEISAGAAQSILCLADELLADPELLHAAAPLLDVPGKTLAIYAPDADAGGIAGLESAVEAAGLADAKLELVVLAVARDVETERTLAGRVDALLTRRAAPAPFDRLRRIDPSGDGRPRFELAVCAIARNEGRYLPEWIEFHKLVGVEHFYVYDNLSDDDTEAVLAPYVAAGVVTVVPWPLERQGQCPAYMHCVSTFGADARWIAFIDCDEFLYAPAEGDLKDVLREFEPYGGVHVNSVSYGTSGRESRPDGLVIESYLYRASHDSSPPLAAGLRAPDRDPADPASYYPMNARVKSIVQPTRVLESRSPHYWIYREGWHAVTENHVPHDASITGDVSVTKLRLNHYWTKSVEECKAKFERGRADTPKGTEGRSWPGDFDLRNAHLNDELDVEILAHLPALRRALALPEPRPIEVLRAECEQLWAVATERQAA